MSPIAGLGIGLAVLLAVTALASSRTGARVALLLTAVSLPLPLWVNAHPGVRVMLAFAFLVPFLCATSFASTPIGGFRRRWAFIVCTYAFVDASRAVRVGRHWNSKAATHLIVATAILVLTALAWLALDPMPNVLRVSLRTLCALVLFLALGEVAEHGPSLVAGLIGFQLPPRFRQPFRSQSVGEFWGKRWNGMMEHWLRDHCYRALAGHSPRFALWMTFAASAAIHAYIALAVDLRSALLWGAFFLAQPFAIGIEHVLKVHRWPPLAGVFWTYAWFAVLVPLLVLPMLPFFGASY